MCRPVVTYPIACSQAAPRLIVTEDITIVPESLPITILHFTATQVRGVVIAPCTLQNASCYTVRARTRMSSCTSL